MLHPRGYGIKAGNTKTNMPEKYKDLLFRPVSFDDAELLFDWVNRSDSLAGKLRTTEAISIAQHRKWLNQRLSDPLSRIWIAVGAGLPVGQVRLEGNRQSKDLEVDIFVLPEARGRHVALSLLSHAASSAARQWPSYRLRATVRRNNMNSQLLFERAGYRQETKQSNLEMMVYSRASNAE
jgi:RimJ/RimL family protein N-acetyltransferase